LIDSFAIELPAFGGEKRLQELGPAETVFDQRPVELDRRQSGQRAERDLFDRRLRRVRQRDRVAVAAEARWYPKDVDHRFARGNHRS